MMKNFSTSSFIVGVMVGALLTGAWLFGSEFGLAMPSPSSYTASSQPAPKDSGAVSVANQPAGESVVVESVTVPPPGVWVAVREILGNDLANVLGAARATGPRSQFTVPLLRATLPGRSYAIQLYRDDNAGAFDPAQNSVYVDFDTGERVVVYFATDK